MFCKSCGAALPADASFCPACGTRIDPVRAQTQVPDAVSRQAETVPPARALKSRRLQIIVAGVVVAAVLGALSISSFQRDDTRMSSGAESTAPAAPSLNAPAAPGAEANAPVAAAGSPFAGLPPIDPSQAGSMPGMPQAGSAPPIENSPGRLNPNNSPTQESAALPSAPTSPTVLPRTAAPKPAKTNVPAKTTGELATAPVSPAVPAAQASSAAPATPMAAAPRFGSPKEQCADRPNFISRALCETRACERPEWVGHSYCAQLRERAAQNQPGDSSP